MEKDEPFRIKSYTWKELAGLYSPDITVGAAVKRLTRWVEHHPLLGDELAGHGWKKADRILSPRQVEVVVRHLGEP